MKTIEENVGLCIELALALDEDVECTLHTKDGTSSGGCFAALRKRDGEYLQVHEYIHMFGGHNVTSSVCLLRMNLAQFAAKRAGIDIPAWRDVNDVPHPNDLAIEDSWKELARRMNATREPWHLVISGSTSHRGLVFSGYVSVKGDVPRYASNGLRGDTSLAVAMDLLLKNTNDMNDRVKNEAHEKKMTAMRLIKELSEG